MKFIRCTIIWCKEVNWDNFVKRHPIILYNSSIEMGEKGVTFTSYETLNIDSDVIKSCIFKFSIQKKTRYKKITMQIPEKGSTPKEIFVRRADKPDVLRGFYLSKSFKFRKEFDEVCNFVFPLIKKAKQIIQIYIL